MAERRNITVFLACGPWTLSLESAVTGFKAPPAIGGVGVGEGSAGAEAEQRASRARPTRRPKMTLATWWTI